MKRRTMFALFVTCSLFFLELKEELRKWGNEMKESKFQSDLIKELKERFPGCIVMKNDASYIQGIPDLLVLYFDKWATLECKKSSTANYQPNQNYYVNKMNGMSFSRFIYPENKEEVINDLERTFKIERETQYTES